MVMRLGMEIASLDETHGLWVGHGEDDGGQNLWVGSGGNDDDDGDDEPHGLRRRPWGR